MPGAALTRGLPRSPPRTGSGWSARMRAGSRRGPARTGWPVLVAVSNKDFIGETLGLGVGERAEGTIAALAISAWLGARVFRVHDVPAARRALTAITELRRGWPD